MNKQRESTVRQRGPHAGLVAAVAFGLVVAGLVIGGSMSGGATLQSPFTASEVVAARTAEHPGAFRISAFFQLGAAIPLAVYAATVFTRLRRIGVAVPGPAIALVGGALAASCLVVSGCATYVQGRPELAGIAPLVHALALLAFASGGPAFCLGFGLLIAGVAVPTFVLRLGPRWLGASGLILAAIGELTWLAVVFDPMQYLLPVTRFGGGMWLIAAGFVVAAARPGAPAEVSA